MPAGNLLYWALVALVVALIAAALGFGGIAGTAAGIAKILFWIFLVIFLVVLVMNFLARNNRRADRLILVSEKRRNPTSKLFTTEQRSLVGVEHALIAVGSAAAAAGRARLVATDPLFSRQIRRRVYRVAAAGQAWRAWRLVIVVLIAPAGRRCALAPHR